MGERQLRPFLCLELNDGCHIVLLLLAELAPPVLEDSALADIPPPVFPPQNALGDFGAAVKPGRQRAARATNAQESAAMPWRPRARRDRFEISAEHGPKPLAIDGFQQGSQSAAELLLALARASLPQARQPLRRGRSRGEIRRTAHTSAHT